MNNFQIAALPAGLFAVYFSKTDEELAEMGAKRMTVNVKPGFPCRVSLEEGELGEEVILLPFAHHEVDSPYRASGPIFVRKNVATRQPLMNEIPPVLQLRLLSLRAYDRAAMMRDARVVQGSALAETISQMFDAPAIEYIHIHNAKPGCFSCEVRRAMLEP